MKILAYYKKVALKNNLKYDYDKTSKGRPAWIEVSGLPKNTNFIKINLGKKGREGARIQFYKTYIIKGLFLPIDHTSEEIKKFYDKWANDYDDFIVSGGTGAKGQNIIASNFLLNKVKKHIQRGEFLDLGAGTGIITEKFVNAGFGPATIVDYSEGMINNAKKRKALKKCAFIKEDIRKLNMNKKFPLIISSFSFASSSYFKKEELPLIVRVVKKHLKKGGIFALMGHTSLKIFNNDFEKLEAGIYDLSTKNKFYCDYFIGRKK